MITFTHCVVISATNGKQKFSHINFAHFVHPFPTPNPMQYTRSRTFSVFTQFVCHKDILDDRKLGQHLQIKNKKKVKESEQRSQTRRRKNTLSKPIWVDEKLLCLQSYSVIFQISFYDFSLCVLVKSFYFIVCNLNFEFSGNKSYHINSWSKRVWLGCRACLSYLKCALHFLS